MELLRALGRLAEPPTREHASLARLLDLPSPDDAAFTDLFVLQLYPYASVYLGAEGLLGGQARDRIAGFFRALDVTPPPEPDHLALLLGTLADLAEREAAASDTDAAAAWRRSRAALLWEHVLSWVPMYAGRVVAHSRTYAPWARLLLDALRHEAATVGPPSGLPLQLRAAPPLDDPASSDLTIEGFIDQLLAPVRTGMILTRSDLVRAANQLGLGVRIGERRYVLSALLPQAPGEVLAWLADEASRRVAAHVRYEWTAPLATFWVDRAQATEQLLRSLSADADGVMSAASGAS